MRGFLSIAVMAIAILSALLGIWWICQGTGLVPVGFMANNMQWAYRGAVLVAFGGAMIWLARRI